MINDLTIFESLIMSASIVVSIIVFYLNDIER